MPRNVRMSETNVILISVVCLAASIGVTKDWLVSSLKIARSETQTPAQRLYRFESFSSLSR